MCVFRFVVCFLGVLVGVALGGDGDKKGRLMLEARGDFLALHVSGVAPAGARSLEFRFSERGNVGESAGWTVAPVALENGGAFSFDVPLPNSRWGELEVRAGLGGSVFVEKSVRQKGRVFELLSAERIGMLSAGEREAWSAYMSRSEALFEAEFDALAAECRRLGLGAARVAPGNSRVLEVGGDASSGWFGGAEAGRLADVALSFQTPSGGWSKAVDYAKGRREAGMHWTSQGGNPWHYCGTLDNRSSTEQIELLAGVGSVANREDAKAGAVRGVEWLLAAQFPNGGWPQNYPVEPGYHEAMTLNDGAMLHALETLQAVAEGRDFFGFMDGGLRERARAAYDRGVGCLLAAQVRVNGVRTVWCAQHDPLSLAPVGARKKEPASLSGGESADLLRHLMREGPGSEEVIGAVEAALVWFEGSRVSGLRRTKGEGGKTDYVPDAESKEVYWARFYDLVTGKPMFAGGDDGVVYGTFTEMAAKNKVGYDYFVTRPRDVLEKEVPRWRKRLERVRQ